MRRVGNDVVDLRDPRCAGKAGHRRFVDRVLTAGEAAVVRASPDPDLALWLAWACKEAAYKVDSKCVDEPPAFDHSTYDADLSVLRVRGDGEEPLATRVSGPTRTVPARAWLSRTSIHVVAWLGPGATEGSLPEDLTATVRSMRRDWGQDPDLWRESLADRFTGRELETIHRAESALVRLWARDAAAERTGSRPDELEIVCPRGVPGRSPPVLLRGGEPAPLDVSLSHHGDLVAWALLPLSPGEGGTAGDESEQTL